MPKVSEEHLQRRRQQILDAAKTCFATKGFHSTSMQDIFAASGLSAGAVYRYFPSKTDLILAISKESVEDVLASIACESAPGGVAAVLAVLGSRLAEDRMLGKISPIAPQVWAGATRDPEIATAARDLIETLTARVQALLPEGTPPQAAKLIVATLQGFVIRQAVIGDVTPELIHEMVDAAFG
jgi:TetR/AcrR family transcriptional regulator, transcriptional repressor of aconitase